MYQKTLCIIKPDAVRRSITKEINKYITGGGLVLLNSKTITLTPTIAAKFYEIHKERNFFNDLVKYMVSGPVVVQLLAAGDAITRYREIMGHTNPAEASKGTIRGDFATSIEENCVHGSDSEESAKIEIPFFFAEYELIN